MKKEVTQNCHGVERERERKRVCVVICFVGIRYTHTHTTRKLVKLCKDFISFSKLTFTLTAQVIVDSFLDGCVLQSLQNKKKKTNLPTKLETREFLIYIDLLPSIM